MLLQRGNIIKPSDITSMTLLYFRRTLLLLILLRFTISSNETMQCEVCQAPIKQNLEVPWAHLLSNATYIFWGTQFREIRVLPKNAFIAAPLIQVCIQTYKCIVSIKDTYFMPVVRNVLRICILLDTYLLKHYCVYKNDSGCWSPGIYRILLTPEQIKNKFLENVLQVLIHALVFLCMRAIVVKLCYIN